jgi:tetratricopeptide (TPR) repeat protein
MFPKRHVVWVVALMFAGSVLVLPAPSSAAGKAEAKRHFENGLAMMELEDFDGAAVEFEASLALYASQNAMFNLAMCYKAQHKYPKALEMFRTILKTYGRTMSPEDRKEVKKNIKLISGMVGNLEVKTNIPEAVVLIDGEKVGITPLGTLVAAGAGEHQVRVSKNGYETQEKLVTVVAGKNTAVAFTLVEGADAAAPVPVVAPAGPPPEQVEVEAVIGGNLTRDYIRYTKTRANEKESFAQYEYKLATKKRTNGIILMAAIAPIVMGIGVGAYAALLWSMEEEDATDPDYDQIVVDNTAKWNAAVFLISLAGAGALTTLIVGSVRVARGHTKMKKLKPLLAGEKAGGAKLRLIGFAPLFDPSGVPGGAAVTFSF